MHLERDLAHWFHRKCISSRCSLICCIDGWCYQLDGCSFLVRCHLQQHLARQPLNCSQIVCITQPCVKEEHAILKQHRSNAHLFEDSKTKSLVSLAAILHSMGMQNIPLQGKVAADVDGCNICLSDVWLEALWDQKQKDCFHLLSNNHFRTIPMIQHGSVALCCLARVAHCQWTQWRC